MFKNISYEKHTYIFLSTASEIKMHSGAFNWCLMFIFHIFRIYLIGVTLLSRVTAATLLKVSLMDIMRRIHKIDVGAEQSKEKEIKRNTA